MLKLVHTNNINHIRYLCNISGGALEPKYHQHYDNPTLTQSTHYTLCCIVTHILTPSPTIPVTSTPLEVNSCKVWS